MPDELEGQVKPELLQSVLEIATTPCDDVARRRRASFADLRRAVIEIAERRACRSAPPATHPFARWEDQEIADRPRYRELVDELGSIARRELIFGTHVHVAIEGADRAIYVADGIRRYLPLLLALSANSPFWRGAAHRLDVLANAGLPRLPARGDPAPLRRPGRSTRNRVEQMMRGGAIEDYTYLWWDVRPHPQPGHGRDADLRPADAPRAHRRPRRADRLLAHRICALYDDDEPLVEYPTELIDDNKVRAARRGMDGDADRLLRAASRCPPSRWRAGCSTWLADARRRARLLAPSSRSVERPARQRHRRPPPARLVDGDAAT